MTLKRTLAAALAALFALSTITPVHACTRRVDILNNLGTEFGDIVRTYTGDSNVTALSYEPSYTSYIAGLPWNPINSAIDELTAFRAEVARQKEYYKAMSVEEWMNYPVPGTLEDGQKGLDMYLGYALTQLDSLIALIPTSARPASESASTPTTEPASGPANPYDDVQK
jgi:hypothetical protein